VKQFAASFSKQSVGPMAEFGYTVFLQACPKNITCPTTMKPTKNIEMQRINNFFL
jgi:hypothetical protein